MRRIANKILGLFCLMGPSLLASEGLDRAIQRVPWSDPIGGKLAVADFDRDQKQDGAVLLRPNHSSGSGRYSLEVHFSNRPHIDIPFDSIAGAIGVTARDVDHDNDSDLVVEQQFSSKGVKVWLNDGDGDFHEGRVEDYPELGHNNPVGIAAPSVRPRLLAIAPPTRSATLLAVLTSCNAPRPPTKGTLGVPAGCAHLCLASRRADSARAPPSFSIL
jgi:hypothetical protein